MNKELIEQRIAHIKSDIAHHEATYARQQNELKHTEANHSKLLGHLTEAQHWLQTALQLAATVGQVINPEDKVNGEDDCGCPE